MLEEMQSEAFDQIFSIMERSFPADEYRTYEEQKELLLEPGYHIYVCMQNGPDHGKIVAFMAVWRFADFTYIEHLASDPAVRGQGLGSAILQEAGRLFENQICLEVELPDTDLAKRRIAFYQRNGFCLNSYPYIQPPISKGKQPLPLLIMTSGACITEERFQKIREELYREVYKQPVSKGQPGRCRGTDKEQPGQRDGTDREQPGRCRGIDKEQPGQCGGNSKELLQEKNCRQGLAAEQDEIQKTVSQANEQDVRTFLTEILRQDPGLYGRFRLFAVHDISQADMERYRERVHDAIQKYVGKDGSVSYRDAVPLIQELEAILTKDVRRMLENAHYMQAFELTCHIFAEAGNVEMDDSGGEKGVLGAQCVEVWKEIIAHAQAWQQRQMYTWFTGHLDGSMADYLEEYMEQVLMEAFTDREYLEKKLAFTKRRAEEGKDGSDSWSARYYAQKWALRYIRLLEESGTDFAGIAAYCKKQWKYADVRKYYIEKCIGQNNYEDAVAALQESLLMDAGRPGLVRDFSTRLKEVYQMSGRQEEYRQQLWQLVTKDHAGNLEDFQELKTLYSEEEWLGVREEVFQALPPQAHVECLYKEEALYDRLLEYVLQAKGLYAVQQYQSILQDIYPQQLLQKYTDELKDMVQRAADRRHYQEWAALLRKMLQIPGGQEKVRQIVAYWRVRYKNRPVMMEELKQF